MKNTFVRLSNTAAFMTGYEIVERRGAAENCFMVVDGKPGYGKTSTAHWFAISNGLPFVRAKREWRPSWMLRELLETVQTAPAHSYEKIFQQVIEAMGKRSAIAGVEEKPFAIIVDEADHVVGSSALMETLRDISDLVEVPILLIGMGRISAGIILGTTGSAYVDKFNSALGTATTGLESFASSAKGAATGSTGSASGYPDSLALTPAQAARMPAGVSAYGTGWAEQQVGALNASFSVLNQGVSSIVDQFVPGLGSVLSQLLNGISSASGGSGGSGFFSWLGSLFGGGSGWGANNSAAFMPYAYGGIPPGRGLHSYANTIVSTPTVFAFAKGAGVMGEAGEKEGIFPLTRDAAGRLGVRASWGGGQGGEESGSNIVINNFSGAQVTHETSRDSRGRRQEKFVISDAVGDAVSTPGGGADRAMRTKYGMRSGGIRR